MLEDWYGNKQAIITAHTKKVLKPQCVESNFDVTGLWIFYDDAKVQVRTTAAWSKI